MANRAVKRDISTLQNELFLCHGQVVISGPYGAPGSSIQVNGLTGSLPTVLSGSSPNQFTSQYTITRFGSGSYAIQMKDVWPRLLSAQFTLGASGSQGANWKVQHDAGVAPRSDTTGSAGVNQVGFALFNAPVTTGSVGAPVLADPSGSINALTVNVALAFANSNV